MNKGSMDKGNIKEDGIKKDTGKDGIKKDTGKDVGKDIGNDIRNDIKKDRVRKETMKKSKSEKRKKGGVVNVILDILLVLFLCTAIFSGYKVASQLITDKQGEDVYDDIASLASMQETIVVKKPKPAATDPASMDVAGIAAAMEAESSETAGTEPESSDDGENEDGHEADPDDEEGVPSGEDDSYDEEPEPIVIRQFDWAGLRAENSDCVGWLECDDTVISYPVVQGSDNSYYLNHLFNGKQQRYGTLFIDAENSPDFSDENTIIYGHHLKNGKMFGTLVYYGNGNKYYRKHPVFKLYTPEHVYLVELFANAYVDGAKGIPMTFSTKEKYAEWIDKMYRLSTFDSDVVMTTDDRMVTLYTCSYDYDTQRQLLVGKLVELT